MEDAVNEMHQDDSPVVRMDGWSGLTGKCDHRCGVV
jgi:hypothetical protein